MRGRKPKPAALKLILGNPGKRPIRPDPAANLDPAFDNPNPIEPPKRLKKRQREIWDQFVKKCPWLTALDAPVALLWTELFCEFEASPRGMVASRIAQLRAASAELGLNPSSHTRIGAEGEAARRSANDPAKKYF